MIEVLQGTASLLMTALMAAASDSDVMKRLMHVESKNLEWSARSVDISDGGAGWAVFSGGCRVDAGRRGGVAGVWSAQFARQTD
jgi:hypothetical protein